MISTSIAHEGIILGYHKAGDGFPLVFIHGFCEDHTIWKEFVEPYTARYSVLLPDLPGFGQSTLPANACTMDFYADCIIAMLTAEKIDRCAIIGHSMGGYITLNIAERYPQYLAGFGLFHSLASEDDAAKKKDRERVADFVTVNGSAPFVRELYKVLFAPQFANTHRATMDMLEKHAEETSTAKGVARAAIAMRDRRDTTAVLKKTKVPVLFIIGKEDKAISTEKSMQQSHLPAHSVISLLRDTGHMGMIESPAASRLAVHEWLSLIS